MSLPTINIMGTEFLVDVMKEELREMDNESNSIPFNHLIYKKPNYFLAYDETKKNANLVRPWQTNVKIDEFIKIDPHGMAKKYDMPVKEIRHKNDYDLRINQAVYGARMFNNRMPIIDISGVRYYVDLEKSRLRITEGKAKVIQLKDTLSSEGHNYFYYHPEKKEVLSLKQLSQGPPEGVVKVALPADYVLDPVIVANREGYDLRDFLMKHPIQEFITAKLTPVEKKDLYKDLARNKDKWVKTANANPLPKKNRQSLPTIEIMGTEFIVDVHQGQFREKANERNCFSLYDLEYKGTHYEMNYREKFKNPHFAHSWECVIRIPQLIEIDPQAMAAKYGLSVKDLEGKTDFDLRVDKKIFHERFYRGKPPVIDIAGDRFFVDMRWDELRWVEDISKRILLRDHKEDAGDKYSFYYDKSTKEAISIDAAIIQSPERLVKVVLPDDYILDPLAESRITSVFRPYVGENEIKDFLMKNPFEKNLKAEVTALSETLVAELGKRNKAALQEGKDDQLLTKNRESIGKEKGKGKHQ